MSKYIYTNGAYLIPQKLANGMAEGYRDISQRQLTPGMNTHLEIFGASLDTALRLARLGHRIRRWPESLKAGFFCIEVGQTTVFVCLPE